LNRSFILSSNPGDVGLLSTVSDAGKLFTSSRGSRYGSWRLAGLDRTREVG